MMPEENLAAESRSPCDRSAGQGRGRPLRPPARPGGKESGGCGGSEFPSSPGPSLLRGIRSPAQIPAAGPLPGKGGRASGQAEESSTCHFGEAVDFHMVEGGGRACARSWESRGLPRPPSGVAGLRPGRPWMLGGEGSPGDRWPPPPPGPLGDTPRPPLATSARHVLPPRPAPWAPPGLGAGTGGRGWTRRARRLQARAGESGARREAEDGAGSVRVGQRSARGSVGQARGAPLPGVGRAGRPSGWNPGPEAAGRAGGGRAGRAAGTVWFGWQAGRNELPWEGPVSSRGKRGPGPCPPCVPSAQPGEPGVGAGSASVPGRPGWAAGRRRWPGAFPE